MKTARGWSLGLLAVFLFTGLSAVAQDHAAAPPWALKDTAGRTVRLEDYRGKVVLLNFWATWCAPCRKEIPGLVALQERYGSRGFTVIGLSIDGEERIVAGFARGLGINYPVVLGTPIVAASYGGVTDVPTTFVIDRAGKIAAVHQGAVDAETFAGEIKPLL